MSSELDTLVQLKTQLVNFLDELIDSFPNEPDFVIFRIFVNDKIPIESIMKYITENLCPLQDMVKNKDEQFFLSHNILFEKFSEKESSKVNHFKKLWTSGMLDKDDKEVMWKWFRSFIYLGNKYMEYKNVTSNKCKN
jgi:hypothetical protein